MLYRRRIKKKIGKRKKPLAMTSSTISITGVLTKIKRGFNCSITFEIKLDNIAYLSRQSGGPSGTSNRTYTTPSYY